MVQGAISRQLKVLRTQAGAETPAGAYSYEAPAGGGITAVGDVVEVHSSVNSSSAVIAVPVGATCMVLGVCGYDSVTAAWFTNRVTLTLAGASLTLGRGDDPNLDNGFSAILWITNAAGLPSGDQTLVWDWAGTDAADAGIHFFCRFYTGVNTTTPIRSNGGEAAPDTTATAGVLTAVTGDKVVAVGFNDGATGGITWTSGATEIASDTTLLCYGSLGEGNPTGNVTVSVTGTNNFTNVTAVVLQPAA